MGYGTRFPVDPRNYTRLAELSLPANAGAPEAIPFVYYDTATLATNWTTASFFATPQTDKTLGNIEQGGTIPADTYFQLYSVNLDFLIPTVANSAATADAVGDVLQIFWGARATFNLNIEGKTYGPIPASCLHGTGGVEASIVGVPAAAALANVGQNLRPDGGWWADGAIILRPTASFSVRLDGVAAALVASRQVRISMMGVKYRVVR
ncbi:MAG: hypothetical protein WC729_30015 [Sphingomonas sp.]|jgi:hypothetical protein|uniref:hypothetical protein n=1 Tax=Sphingomonas sp. TaxID=28214 RepID=UPI00356759AC